MSFSRFREAAREKPIEFLSAVVMVGIGIAVSLLSPTQTLLGLGGILATIGGALFSWSAATVGTVDQAVQILRPQLESTSRQLGTVSGQIGRAVTAVQEGFIAPETAFALVLQSNRTLYSFVSELQLLTGTQLDTQVLVDTMEQLEDLAERLTTYGDQRREPQADDARSTAQPDLAKLLGEELESIRLQLGSQLGHIEQPGRKAKRTRIVCPTCSSTFDWQLGINHGDSGLPQCAICGTRFHIHRRADGGVITRQMGSANAAEDDPTLPYDKILRDQGIRLVPPKWRPVALAALARALEKAPDSLVTSWEELDRRTLEQLTEKGYMSDPLEVKKARQLAYRTKVLRFTEDRRIGLADGVGQANISAQVDSNLVRRIVEFTGPETNPAEVNALLHAGDGERLQEMEKLVEETARALAAPAPTEKVEENGG